MPDLPSSGIVFLAAGSSRRMGEPKQLLPNGDCYLLRSVLDSTICLQLSPFIVVLGANADLIGPSLAGLPIHIIVNYGWREGMGSSIRVGMQALLHAAPRTARAIISLADQPGLSATHMFQLMATQRRTARSIVASSFKGKLTPPALFSSSHFGKLMTLRGDTGARSIFRDNQKDVAVVAFNDLGDIDTPEDYDKYLKGQGNAPHHLEAKTMPHPL